MGWREAFQTEHRAQVERHCRERGIATAWRGGGRLRTSQVLPAVAVHPGTREPVWFNHAVFFHVTSLPAEISTALRAQFAEPDLPVNTSYGDGEPIPDEVLDHLRGAYAAERIAVPWQAGDVLLVDNLLAAHGRQPYTGDRRVVVAMTGPCPGTRHATGGPVTARRSGDIPVSSASPGDRRGYHVRALQVDGAVDGALDGDRLAAAVRTVAAATPFPGFAPTCADTEHRNRHRPIRRRPAWHGSWTNSTARPTATAAPGPLPLGAARRDPGCSAWSRPARARRALLYAALGRSSWRTSAGSGPPPTATPPSWPVSTRSGRPPRTGPGAAGGARSSRATRPRSHAMRPRSALRGHGGRLTHGPPSGRHQAAAGRRAPLGGADRQRRPLGTNGSLAVVALLAWCLRAQGRPGGSGFCCEFDLRDYFRLGQVLGPLTDRLAFRVDVEDARNPTFAEVMRRTQAGFLDSVVHYLPYPRLLDHGLRTGALRAPHTAALWDVAVRFCHDPPRSARTRDERAPTGGGVSVELFREAELLGLGGREGTAPDDGVLLDVHVGELDDAMVLVLDYALAGFAAAAVDHLLCQLERLIDQVSADPAAPLPDLGRR
ncbi:TauD/TfdA family dioxygenase [Streptomyces sp. M19]